MKPPPFAYHRPESLQEAATLLRAAGGGAKLLAGGQSLIPLLNFRLARPSALIDLARVPDLDYVRLEGAEGTLRIGARTCHADIEQSALARTRHPLLVEVIGYIGHPAIRHRGTVGGSIAHADPASELACLLVTLGGSVRTEGADGGRVIPADSFFQGYMQTALQPDEIVVEVQWPLLPPGRTGWAFEELSRRHGDFALAMAAVWLRLDETGRVAQIGIGLGGVAPAPIRARAAEEQLLGAEPMGAILDAAAAAIRAATDPDEDIHATAEDRRHLAVVLGRHALATAVQRAQATPEVAG